MFSELLFSFIDIVHPTLDSPIKGFSGYLCIQSCLPITTDRSGLLRDLHRTRMPGVPVAGSAKAEDLETEEYWLA